jgi:hypothetical protein
VRVRLFSPIVRRSVAAVSLFVWLARPGTAGSPAAAPSPSPPPSPVAGDLIPAFEAEAIDGKTQKIDFPKGSKTILVFFLSSCPVCHRMIPEWNRAYGERKGINMYGVILDKEPPGFFLLTPIEFPVVRAPGRAFLDKIKVFRVPVTMRVGPGGKVEDAAQGQIDRMRLSQFFHP